MVVHVRLVGTLKKYVPDHENPNDFIVSVPEGTTISEIGALLAIPENELFAFTKNKGQLKKGNASVNEGDIITLYSVIAGG